MARRQLASVLALLAAGVALQPLPVAPARPARRTARRLAPVRQLLARQCGRPNCPKALGNSAREFAKDLFWCSRAGPSIWAAGRSRHRVSAHSATRRISSVRASRRGQGPSATMTSMSSTTQRVRFCVCAAALGDAVACQHLGGGFGAHRRSRQRAKGASLHGTARRVAHAARGGRGWTGGAGPPKPGANLIKI